jgi:D-glycero-alpha-D-manno-heptose-7-phosphate kinase
MTNRADSVGRASSELSVIVTRTPFRVTLGGGGTDLPSFYEKHGGYICALGIDKYMYVALNVPYADRKVRLHYTRSETVDHVSQLEHELAREALLRHGINDGVEIASLADLPAGTGLGSSSAYLVGLLNAIRAYRARPATFEDLAAEACEIELDTLAKPIGKQDQYMAAAAGLTELRIDPSGRVTVERIGLPGYAVSDLISKTHLYYTNVQRTTTQILGEQTASLKRGSDGVEDNLVEILAIGRSIGAALRALDFDEFGRLMHAHWLAKKRLSSKVSLPAVEELYDVVRRDYGVLGGKVAGAGGGGFLMLYCPHEGARLTEFMAAQGMERLTYGAEFEGSKIVVNLMASRSIDFHSSAAVEPSHTSKGPEVFA